MMNEEIDVSELPIDGPVALIDGDKTALESTPLEKVTIVKEIRAFKHEGFWQCMDHKLDKDLLDQMIKNGKTPWIKK